MQTSRVLIAGSRDTDLRKWRAWLGESAISSSTCISPQQVLQHTGSEPTLLFIGICRNDAGFWLRALHRFRENTPRLRTVILAIESSEDLAIEALRAGASDYHREPLTSESLVDAVRLWLDTRSCAGKEGGQGIAILGESQTVVNLRSRLNRLSGSDCNVLITGESGTGKELAAAAIHRDSSRSNARLVCLNCAAIPDSLVESELFGYDKGAFTGAEMARDGKLKAADGGVIFLDEIGDLSPFAQAKILRAVEAKEFYRLGSQHVTTVNVRVVAATHRNLEQMVAEGRFRQDLFFRLNIGRVHIPPLRERIEDLRLLVMHYVRMLNPPIGYRVRGLSDDAWKVLQRYSWPGNIRELRNVVESAMVNSLSDIVDVEDLPPHIRALSASEHPRDERGELVNALHAAEWNKTKAAEKLHWSRMTLYRKMAKYSVSNSRGKRLF